MNVFEGIIDVYDENSLDFDEVDRHNIKVIFHETSMGLFKIDSKYAARKVEALKRGILWAGFHLLSDESVDMQLDRFLGIEDGSNPEVGLAIDWERSKKGLLPYPLLREFVQKFHDRMKPRYTNRYPILYGSNFLRETPEIMKGDPLLAKCPLWYVWMPSGKMKLPTNTWPTYTFWQFDNEHRVNGAPPKNVLPGADFNRFDGPFENLQSAWPFAASA